MECRGQNLALAKKFKAVCHNMWRRVQSRGLTLSLWDGAGDGRAGGGDCAHRRAHAVGRIDARHGCRMGHPGCRVNGPDGLTWDRRQPV